jgi:3-deoxy-manno-octulosonate cytidylyltransferase (CMP-KDO synthetase)
VQGDEPFLDPHTVRACIDRLRADPDAGVATPVVPLSDPAAFRSPHIVKALPDAAGRAITFSRAPIPAEARSTAEERHAAWQGWLESAGVATGPDILGFKHVGLYVFRRDVLLRFTELAPSRLEQLEKLEQLRLLENGIRLALVPVARDSVGIDTPEDLVRAEELLDTV